VKLFFHLEVVLLFLPEVMKKMMNKMMTRKEIVVMEK
jgi:hypothetical protein